MADSNGSGRLQGRVDLRIPTLDSGGETIEFKGVTVTLVANDGERIAETDANGTFVFDALADGDYHVRVEEELTYNDGSQSQVFQLVEGSNPFKAKISASVSSIDVDPFVYAIKSLDQGDAMVIKRLETVEHAAQTLSERLSKVETVGVPRLEKVATDIGALSTIATAASQGVTDNKVLVDNTVSSIAGIESALRDMATYPFSGPSDSENGMHPAGSLRRPAAASNGVRSGVTSALADLGIMGDLTDDELARLFPAETDEDGEVSYRWAGPSVTTRSSARSAGARKPGTVQVSGALARFQQKAKVALTEIQEVLATIQPFDGHDVDPRALATQKTIVLQTMQSIVNEPERPDGLRQLAVDLHFTSLLKDEIVVDRYGTTVEGNLGVLKDLLGISDALVIDQEAETHVTEWNRVEDAAESARDAWVAYKKKSSKPELRFGERLQELHGYFGALSEAAQDARAMLRTVRFTPQEQATQKFSTPAGDEITTDDLLSMVEDLANEIGPTYITDWKGRGIATVGARATSLRDTTDGMIATGRFPFSSPRVREAFVDITRLLDETAIVCDKIKADMLPAGVAGFGAP